MSRLYVFRIKSILRDKPVLFWSLIFPMLLGTFFALAFGSITQGIEKMQAIPLAVVQGQESPAITAALEELSQGESALLKVTQTDEETALKWLDEGKVDGVWMASTMELVLQEEGVRQSMLKGILDRCLQIETTLTHVAQKNAAALPQALEVLTAEEGHIRQSSFSTGNTDDLAQYFYALIGMACLYGGFFGITTVKSAQADQSPLGARRSITPTPKTSLVMADFLASLTVAYAGVCLLLMYLKFVLGVNVGSQWAAIGLLCLAGSACGVMLGMVMGIAVRGGEGVKDGVYIALSLTLSFFGGLMYHNMRHVVEEYVPLFNRINPASLLVDSFYALDAYGAGARYWGNIGGLCAITLILGIVSILCLRRKQYASI